MDSGYLYIIIICAVFGICVLLFFSLHIYLLMLKKENRQLMERCHEQNLYIDEISRIFDDASVIIDQVREFSNNLQLCDEQTDCSRQLHKKCISECDSLISKINSGNTVVDALLYNKHQRCSSLGITLNAEIHILPSADITDPELVMLIGNLLDNSIEAAAVSESPEPCIRIRSAASRGIWFLSMMNTKNPDIHPMESNMHTTKEDVLNHGLGVKIIRQIVERHHGYIKMTDEGDAFRILISLQNSTENRHRQKG
ncbi:MAG: sensor histidine kinase [Lentihominibacter sp.]